MVHIQPMMGRPNMRIMVSQNIWGVLGSPGWGIVEV